MTSNTAPNIAPNRPITAPRRFLQRMVQAATAGLVTVLASTVPARSAENIYFDYGPLGRVLPVSSLEAYAADGTVDETLAFYLNLLPAEAQTELQQILSTPLTDLAPEAAENLYSPFVLSQWLQSPVGEQVLLRTGEGFQTVGRFNGQQALRGAMVLAAADPEGLTLLNILRYFPTEGIRIDLVKLLALGQALQTNFATTEQLVADMTQLSLAAAETEPELDYAALPLLGDLTPFGVAERSLMVEDQDRDRSFPVDLFLPNDLAAVPSPVPVIVFSHGYGDTRQNPGFRDLARSLAANGFLVAMPEHIGSNTAYQNDLALGLVNESFQAETFINRPLDISVLLDTLEQKNANDFQGRLQLDQVGLMGHSLGGYTAFATAGATVDMAHLEEQCVIDETITPENINIALLLVCRIFELNPTQIQQLTNGSLADERVGMVIALAPLTNLFGESGMSQLQLPVAIMGGAYDIAAPVVPEQLNAFGWLTTDTKYFYLAENTSHTPELTETVLRLLNPGNDAAQSFEESQDWLFSISRTLMIAHINTHLLGDDRYQSYLTSAYVETVSVEPSRIHLIRELPAPVDAEMAAD